MKTLELLAKRPYTVLILLFALISVNTLKASFLFIDDISLIVNNPHLQFSADAMRALFTTPLGEIYETDYQVHGIYYRPALNLLYMLNNLVWGINPVGFHITNLSLHLATTVLVYRTGMLLFNRNGGASLAAAALFCVHPVHNEIIGRVAMNENLLGFLVAVSLYWYLEKRRLPSLVAFACALLSKESAVMLPFVLMVLETRRHDLKRALPVLSPYLIILAVYLFVRTIVVGFPGSPALNPNRLEQALVACSAVADYVRLLLVPYPLNVFYPAKRFASPLQPELLMSVAVCILIGYAVWKWRSHRELSPLLAGVLLMLAPVLANANRLALGIERGYIAERQLYVPTIFFSLLLAGIMTTYASRAVTRVLAVTLLCLVPVFVAVTIAATGVWANDDVFMARFTRDFPNLSLSHLYKGQILFKSGNLDGAMQESTAALSALPSETLHVLQDPTRKAVLAESQDPDTSRHKETKQSRLLLHYLDFDGLAAYSPEFASVHFLMGLICRDKNDLDCAINKFKVTLALQPHYVGGRAHLAESYLRKGMIQDARREYPRALRDLSRIKGVTYRDTELQRLLCQ